MNLLIFVMALLMLMATITYSRLEHYLTTQVQSIEWQGRVRVGVRTLFNQDPLSCKTKPKPPSSEDALTQTTPKGYGKIPDKYFILPSYRSQHDENLLKAQELFKTLVRILYSDQPFFKNLERDRPTFLDEMLNEITEVSSRAQKKPKSFEDLMYEKWGDPDIKRAFSLMLQSTVSYRRPKPEILIRGEEMKDLEIEKTAPLGQLTLEDYFHDKTTDKIRIWLAQPELLLALYQNQELVDNLIKERKELYKAVSRDLTPASEASKLLEQNYGHNRSPYEALIDFTVTKTKPPK